MSNENELDDILFQIISMWGQWDENEEFYLNELAPVLLKSPKNTASITEREIFLRLQKVLPSDRWNSLPELLQQTRVEKQRRKQRQERNQQEQKRREERRRQKAAELKRNRERFLVELHRCFNQDFLQSLSFHSRNGTSYFSHAEFLDEKRDFIRSWANDFFAHSDVSVPDKQQAAAIASVDANTLVIARAGSGKTMTLIQRAIFLQEHCGISPQEMLLLAFNRDAASEMKEKLAESLHGSIPQSMTFHALAYALVHPEENPLFDEPDGVQRRSLTLQAIIDDFIRSSEGYNKVRAVMLEYFRDDWERIALGGYDKPPRELLVYKRSLPKEGLDGRYYKSYGEKLIADFLFEHDIDYKYERNFYWDGMNYRPDFTIFKEARSGIIIEYFGLSGDPDYDKSSRAKRSFWAKKEGWALLELTPNDIKQSDFQNTLKHELEDQGLNATNYQKMRFGIG